MTLPDPMASRAVLIGAASYDALAALPSVQNNLDSLRGLLCDTGVWGLPAANCTVLQDPGSVGEVLEAIDSAAEAAEDTLVVYYAGHGLTEPNTFNLFLGLPAADLNRLHRAVRYDDVRRIVTRSRCLSKVVLLDCCFSGQAMVGGMSGTGEIADRVRVDGTYLMTASAETATALAPVDENLTAFTGELVALLNRGLEDGPELLDLDTIYWHVRNELASKGRPIPQQRARNDGRTIVLGRNRWGAHRADLTDRTPRLSLPQPPEDLAHAVGLRPRALLSAVADLRDTGRSVDASRLLAAVGAWRGGQEVAAVLDELRRTTWATAGAAAVVTGAAHRPGTEIVDLVEVFEGINLLAEIDQLTAAVAATNTDQVAAVSRALSAHHRERADALLDAAVAARQGDPSSMILLVGALWTTGQQAAAERMLDRAAARMASADAASVADAIRDAGIEGAAFRLYASCIDVIKRRSPSETVPLAAAMRAAGQDDIADRLVGATVEGCQGGTQMIDLLAALWTAGMASSVTTALHHAARRFADADLVQLAERIREHEHPDVALTLLTTAAAGRPAESTVAYVEALRQAGRPIDAVTLLTAAAEASSIEDLVAVSSGLEEADLGDWIDRFLAAGITGRPARAAALLELVWASPISGRGSIRRAVRRAVEKQPLGDLMATAVLLNEAGRSNLAQHALSLAVSRHDEVDAVVFANALGDHVAADPGFVVEVVALIPEPAFLDALLRELTQYGGLPQEQALTTLLQTGRHRAVADALVNLRGTSSGGVIPAFLTAAAGMPPSDVLEFTRYLLSRPGEQGREEASAVLECAASVANVNALAELVQLLVGAGRSDDATTVIAAFRRYRGHTNECFLLASLLKQRKQDHWCEMVLADRQWLPTSAVGDPKATAIAEVIHNEGGARGRCYRYPFEQRHAERIRRSLELKDASLLLVIECGTAFFGNYLALTDRGLVYGRGLRRRSTFTYGDLAKVTLTRRDFYTIDITAHGRRDWLSLNSSNVDAGWVVGLLGKITRLVANFPREAAPSPPNPGVSERFSRPR
ncbi:caspase family protein [Micromonospora sp. NPDC004540]|uniref:caspase, EACC1-associated type n=1 Tax=Micromonospora sp. NPDC004540 TaxID=3154457 RepID=UPI0033B4CB96